MAVTRKEQGILLLPNTGGAHPGAHNHERDGVPHGTPPLLFEVPDCAALYLCKLIGSGILLKDLREAWVSCLRVGVSMSSHL